MKCYYHPQVEAVAICKNCYKAICAECVVELVNGVACKNSKDHCDVEVRNLNLYLDTYKIAAQRAKTNFSRNIIIVGLLGLAFLVFGLITASYNFFGGILPIIIGLVFTSIAIINFFEKRRYENIKN